MLSDGTAIAGVRPFYYWKGNPSAFTCYFLVLGPRPDNISWLTGGNLPTSFVTIDLVTGIHVVVGLNAILSYAREITISPELLQTEMNVL